MRLLLVGVLSTLFVGCSFGVKTCDAKDPCQGGGLCVQGVCTIPEPDAGSPRPPRPPKDAGEYDAGPLIGLVFLTAPHTVEAGVCSPAIQIGMFQDAGPSEDGGIFAVQISPPEDAVFYGEATCEGEPVMRLDVPSNGIVTFYFRSTTTGSVLANVSQNDQEPFVQIHRVVSGGPGRLSFGPAVTVSAGDCSPPITVQFVDSFWNVTVAPYDVPVQLASRPAEGSLFAENLTQFFAGSDVGCQSPLNPPAAQIPAGSLSGSFRFIHPVPGLLLLNGVSRDAGLEVSPAISEVQTVL